MKLEGKKKGSITVQIIVIVLLMAIALFSLMLPAIGIVLMSKSNVGNTPQTSETSNVTCTSWSSAPAGFQADIEKAANKAGVHPALLGAIFLSEHADAWTTAVETDGPFQIEDWQGWWNQVVSSGYGSGTGDVQSMYDSALATAVSLKSDFAQVGIISSVSANASGLTDQKYVVFAGMAHNRGMVAAKEWAQDGFDLNNPPPNTTNPGWEWGATYNGVGYAKRTWTNFQGLNSGCVSQQLGGANTVYNGKTALPIDPTKLVSFGHTPHYCSVSSPNTCGDDYDGHHPFLTLKWPGTLQNVGLPVRYGEAVDLQMPNGNPAYAPFNGTVVWNRPGNPNRAILLKSDDGSSFAILAHMTSVTVNGGDSVTAGQQVGVTGAGHLHFELWINDAPINSGADGTESQTWANMKKALGF